MSDGARRIQLIGWMLIIIGIFDIAQDVYTWKTSQSFFINGAFLLIIPGIAILLGSYRTAVTTTHIVTFIASAYLGAGLALLLFIPPSLMGTAIRHYLLVILKSQISYLIVIGMAIYGYQIITAPQVLATYVPEQGDGSRLRRTMRRWSVGEIVFFFTLVFIVNVIVAFGGTAERAKIEAVKKTGPGYRYYVQKFHIEFRDEGRLRGAYVIAYNSKEMKTIKVTWKYSIMAGTCWEEGSRGKPLPNGIEKEYVAGGTPALPA
jgi:hypothetical protein